ncbi:hypothetical protein SLEP1_g12185 [Rubroshorea leprosula]|uniref:CRIB domain-containing protein n=1 Tax=Rubroshorea leprosula TaxID=152421 RepID=A0AAV5IN18_9ROSI|nr:hypothetical protein SLEP1_g12185 [Rubroshorea leprosula]
MMSGLFRSKSCGQVGLTDGPFFQRRYSNNVEDNGGEEEEEFNEEDDDDDIEGIAGHVRRREWRCGVESGDVSPMDISWPTEVRHVSHVTFDQFNGFLSLPTEFELEVPWKAPSARRTQELGSS